MTLSSCTYTQQNQKFITWCIKLCHFYIEYNQTTVFLLRFKHNNRFLLLFFLFCLYAELNNKRDFNLILGSACECAYKLCAIRIYHTGYKFSVFSNPTCMTIWTHFSKKKNFSSIEIRIFINRKKKPIKKKFKKKILRVTTKMLEKAFVVFLHQKFFWKFICSTKTLEFRFFLINLKFTV